MLASQVALWVSTGRVVLGVFHAESTGNDGQAVPGRVGPVAAAARSVAPGNLAPVTTDPTAKFAVTARAAAAVAPHTHRRRALPQGPGRAWIIVVATLLSAVASEPAPGGLGSTSPRPRKQGAQWRRV